MARASRRDEIVRADMEEVPELLCWLGAELMRVVSYLPGKQQYRGEAPSMERAFTCMRVL
jgi:hypothetical protein